MRGYLLNAWYAAAHSHEVTDKPFARTLLEQPVVLFRSDDGKIVALEDRCPHRFAPLSRGKIQDGEIECGYHGLRFNAEGICSHNPHGPVPPRARVTAYVAVERHGFIWFWPGDPAKADPTTIVDFSYLTDRVAFTTIPGYLLVKAKLSAYCRQSARSEPCAFFASSFLRAGTADRRATGCDAHQDPHRR